MDDPNLFLLAFLFFVIAALYSSVGFGGGSSYLSILALSLSDFLLIKTIALLCNIVVVSGSFYLHWKNGLFDKRKILPLTFFSIPAAFLGATIHLTNQFFFILLGIVLLFSGSMLIIQMFLNKISKEEKKYGTAFNFVVGSGTGFLSGLVGIGGGILLSPILYFVKWGHAKNIVAVSTFFILANSISGLVGQAISGKMKIDLQLSAILLSAVFIGGQVGARISFRLLHPNVIKAITGFLICYIAIKILLKYTLQINI